MKRLAAVAALLTAMGCGGSTTEPEAVYAYPYSVSFCSCTSEQVGHCIDVLTPYPAGPAKGFTCTESTNGFGAVTRGWAYSPSPCPYPDCRMVGAPPADGGCSLQIECVERF